MSDAMPRERAIIYMDLSSIDDTMRKYWELTRGEILAKPVFDGGGDGAGRDHGGGDGEQGNA